MLKNICPITTAPPRSSSCISRLMTCCDSGTRVYNCGTSASMVNAPRAAQECSQGCTSFRKESPIREDLALLKMSLQFVYEQSLDKSKALLYACLPCLASLLGHKPIQEDTCCSQHPHAGDGPPHKTQAVWLLGFTRATYLLIGLH